MGGTLFASGTVRGDTTSKPIMSRGTFVLWGGGGGGGHLLTFEILLQ